MSEHLVKKISLLDDCFYVRYLRTSQIMRTEDFMKQFRAALSAWVKREGYGSQNRLAATAGVSPQYLSEILNEKKDGTEEKRRAIAEAAGHAYEEFLKIGSTILGSVEPPAEEDFPYAAELKQWGEHSEQRAYAIQDLAAAALSIEGPILNFTMEGIKTDPDCEEYRKGKLTDQEYFELCRQKIEQRLDYIDSEIERLKKLRKELDSPRKKPVKKK